MPERVYITLLGRSIWALINSYYTVLREKKYKFTVNVTDPDKKLSEYH